MSGIGAAGNNIVYNATPVTGEFMSSSAFVRFLLGPVGSGKTTGVMFEVMRRACEQEPGPDGIRRTRFAIIRNTLSQMKQTVLKDIETWLGPIAYFKSSENVIEIRAGDIHSDWYMIPLEDPVNQQRLLSLQLTGAWLNEFIEIDSDLIPGIAGRCGRYPSAAQGGATWFGIIGDSNMPNAGSRWHEQLALNVPEDWSVHIQPGGLAPNAENLNWLMQTAETLKLPIDDPVRLAQGRTYYERLARLQSGNWVKRYVHAEFGDDPDGTAVFRESFSRDFHVSKEPLAVFSGVPLLIGQDFGRNPCSLIAQYTPRGQLVILEEVIAENIGLTLHIHQNLKPLLANNPRYIGKRVTIVGDPAGQARNDHTEQTSFDLLEEAHFLAYPAPTNNIEPRIMAVEQLLAQNIGGKPLLLIDGTRCPRLVQALHTKYLYAKRKDGETRSLPEKKHPWSDIVDALQYIALCAQGGYQQQIRSDIERRMRQNVAPARRMSPAAWT